MEVSSDLIKIVFVSSYYDHPLSGVCTFNGKTYWFDAEYGEETVTLRRMRAFERLQKWARRTLFGVCVGWHQHYKDGKRARYFGGRHPKWFWGALANLYYKRKPLDRAFFRWEW